MKLLATALIGVGLVCAVGAGETVDFRDSSITSTTGKDWNGTEDRLWTNAYDKKCKQRATGIAIANPTTNDSSTASAMVRTFETEEPIALVRITVIASTSSVTTKPNLRLGLTLNGGTCETITFDFEDRINTPLTLEFSFSEAQEVTTLKISNESSYSAPVLFEVQTVEWASAVDPIEAKVELPSASLVTAGKTFVPVLTSLTGGSGSYTTLYWTFNGEDYLLPANYLNAVVEVLAPEAEGTFDLELTVEDSYGNIQTFTYPLTVTFMVAPTNLEASEITNSGFSLSWTLGSTLIPSRYTVNVVPAESQLSSTFTLSPKWTQVEVEGETVWESSDVALFCYTHGFAADATSTYLKYSTSGVTITYSTDGGTTWQTAKQFTAALSWYSFTMAQGDTQQIRWRIAQEARPSTLSITYCYAPFALQVEVPSAALGQGYTCTVTELPAGRTYQASVSVAFTTSEGKTVTRTSSKLTVALPSIPTFDSLTVNTKRQRLTLGWPETTEGLSGRVKLYARTIPEHALTEGLYLSRVYYTRKSTDALELCKAVVLTNTSLEAIALDGSYTLSRNTTATDGSTRTYSWDFSSGQDDEKNALYPYSVPACGELMIYYGGSSANPPRKTTDQVIASTATVMNFPAASELVLAKSGTTINTLQSATNALVCLEEDSLTPAAAIEVTNSQSPPAELTALWSELTEDTLLGTYTVEQGKGFAYAYYFPEDDRLYQLWAECYTALDEAYSEVQSTVLWTVSDVSGLLNGNDTGGGFLLRLR